MGERISKPVWVPKKKKGEGGKRRATARGPKSGSGAPIVGKR